MDNRNWLDIALFLIFFSFAIAHRIRFTRKNLDKDFTEISDLYYYKPFWGDLLLAFAVFRAVEVLELISPEFDSFFYTLLFYIALYPILYFSIKHISKIYYNTRQARINNLN